MNYLKIRHKDGTFSYTSEWISIRKGNETLQDQRVMEKFSIHEKGVKDVHKHLEEKVKKDKAEKNKKS
jgi:hypothetical protein